MSFGKLYSYEENGRTGALLAIAKENKLDVELVQTHPPQGSKEFLELSPLAKIPVFRGSDGYVLTESMAIAIYFTSQNEKTTLLGKTKQDYASILRWMSFANMEILPSIGNWFGPLVGRDHYNKKSVEASQATALKVLGVLEKHLLVRTFLVGERLTLADLFAANIVGRGFGHVLDKVWAKQNPNVTRWYETVLSQPIFQAIGRKPIIVEEGLKNVPPKKDASPKKEAKKEAAPKAPKAAPKPAPQEDEEEEAPAAPKAKHPLEALGKPTLILDDWKRKYSNEETREVALPWFWENYKPDEYSLYKVDYKYNDELTMTFMTSNLIGGFFNRLEASRKYLFGALSVYGKTNDSVVTGAFLVRGQDALPAFDVAPDYESYSFTKLDPSKKEDKEFVDDQWAWDKPVVVQGKTYEWADGKVFK